MVVRPSGSMDVVAVVPLVVVFPKLPEVFTLTPSPTLIFTFGLDVAGPVTVELAVAVTVMLGLDTMVTGCALYVTETLTGVVNSVPGTV